MKQELVDVAIRLFGEQGFDATSTRQIASVAGTNMSNITYHFGGKEGLYLAAGQEILERLTTVLNEKPVATLEPGATRSEALSLIDQVVENMGGFMLRDGVAPMARFIAREHDDPSSEFGTLLRAIVHKLGAKMSTAIAVLRPDLSADQCRHKAFFIYAMITGLRNGRAPLCAIAEVPSIDNERGQALLNDLKDSVRDMLGQA